MAAAFIFASIVGAFFILGYILGKKTKK